MHRLLLSLLVMTTLPLATHAQNIRAGIIGLDTSHAVAFTEAFNATPQAPELIGIRVVAAVAQGSRDIASSTSRVPELQAKVEALGVKILPTIDALLNEVDVILLESNDGRVHLEQLLPCLDAGKPTFIDKPVAASLAEAIQIFKAAEAARIPIFSSSSLRFAADTRSIQALGPGHVSHAITRSPATLEPTHPDLFWYGIHGIEALFTVMGPGCVAVSRTQTDDGRIRVTGRWDDGRTGIFEEAPAGNIRFNGTAITTNGEKPIGSFDGYQPLLAPIAHFFRTGVVPVTPTETLEIYAFMEAADESKRRDGSEVLLEEMMQRATSAP